MLVDLRVRYTLLVKTHFSQPEKIFTYRIKRFDPVKGCPLKIDPGTCENFTKITWEIPEKSAARLLIIPDNNNNSDTERAESERSIVSATSDRQRRMSRKSHTALRGTLERLPRPKGRWVHAAAATCSRVLSAHAATEPERETGERDDRGDSGSHPRDLGPGLLESEPFRSLPTEAPTLGHQNAPPRRELHNEINASYIGTTSE